MKYWPVDETKGNELVAHLERIGNKYNKTITQTALNWLLRQPAVTSVIIGTRNTGQLTENTGATDWQLHDEDVTFLDTISKPLVPYPQWHQSFSDER